MPALPVQDQMWRQSIVFRFQPTAGTDDGTRHAIAAKKLHKRGGRGRNLQRGVDDPAGRVGGIEQRLVIEERLRRRVMPVPQLIAIAAGAIRKFHLKALVVSESDGHH